MKNLFGRLFFLICLLFAGSAGPLWAQSSQQIVFAGLRATAGKGQFNAIQIDSAGNLYLLLDQKDGVRVLKTDPSATQIYAQAQLGAAGDIGLAMTLDPAGNLYVTGTTTSGTIAGTSGAAFPTRADASTNSFVAKFDSSLNTLFVTYAGGGRMAAAGIAATSDAVFITGSLFAATLPVSSSAILQAPAAGTTGNGFVERFSSDGTTLRYATYLTGFGGDTSPAAIVADDSDNAYVAGYTNATGYPTAAALVPVMIGTGSGFLTKLAPEGDGILFSTFIPGDGVTSLALDRVTPSLLLSGPLDPGAFPVIRVTAPLAAEDYQIAARLPLDGSAVSSSTFLAPGTQSVVTPASDGGYWTTVSLSTPLLPLATLSTAGTTAAIRINSSGAIDQVVRLGGPGIGLTQSAPVTISGIALDSSSQPLFAGAATPITSASLLATQRFDLPLVNAPTTALPSSVHDAVLPAGTNCGSLCTGSGAYLAKLGLTAGMALSLSIDMAPNLKLRNLGSQAATGIVLTAVGFPLSHNCSPQLDPGAECDILLMGSGPGNITISAANTAVQTASIPAITRTATSLVFAPSEIDFGIVAAASATRTVTVTNLGSTAQAVPFYGTSASNSPFTIATDCANPTSATAIAPGASCHLLFTAAVPSSATVASSSATGWSTGTSRIVATASLDRAELRASATTLDFGTQYAGASSLRLPRDLYLSNNGAASIAHTRVALPSSSPFTVSDRCPSLLEPRTVCQIEVHYLSPVTSSDSATLALDQGLSVLLTGSTALAPGTGGATVNPGLSVTPSTISFANSVLVTTSSATTQMVTIANTGGTPFPLSLTITADFSQSTNCPSILSSGSSCTSAIAFTPSQPGLRQGLLTVSSGAGSLPAYVALSGTGTTIFSAGNSAMDLGSTIVGQPVVLWTKITQSFQQLTASTSGAFGVVIAEDIGYGHGQPSATSFTPTATGSCFNCWLGVQFLPTAEGAATGTLTISSSSSGLPYAISLTGDGLPLSGLVLSPVQQDFGPVMVHSSSAPALFALTNLNSTEVTLQAPVLGGEFTLSSAPSGGLLCTAGTTLTVGASCFLQVVYSPLTTGPVSGTLSISSTVQTATATLAGYGLTDPGVAFTPEALIFRNVPGPTATRQTITVTDTGIYNLQIGSLSTSNATFQVASSCATLTPGSSCTLTVAYAPTEATATGTLTVPVVSLAPGSPQTIYTLDLTGAYTSEDTGLQILPGESSYGPTATGVLGITRQFTVNNLTAKPLALSVSMPRQFVLTSAPCASLEPNGSCSFSAAFLPLTNGDITGTLSAEGTPSDGSASVAALAYAEGYGNGQGALTISGDLSPLGIVDFGQAASGQSSTRAIALTNAGSTPVTVRRITSEWPFLATSTCGTQLAPSSRCTVTLTYSPANQISSGASSTPFNTDTGTLVIESDAASSPEFVDLTGTVTPLAISSPSNTAPLLSYSLSQGSLAFASTSGGNASQPQDVTLTNTGTASIHITALLTTADFSVSSSCGTVLPSASCTITVQFTPQASSTQTLSPVISAIEIASDAGTPLNFISLYGTAIPSTLVLSPVALDFGSILVGSSATLPVQVTNGSLYSAIFGALQTTGDYVLASSSCPGTGAALTPGASCTLQVRFTPTQAGARPGTLSLATSLTSSPLTIRLSGTGSQSQLQAQPTALSFPDTTVGGSAKLTLSLANVGTAPVSSLSFSISGDYTITTPCGATALTSSASCAVGITFTPTASGPRTGTLTVRSSDASSPLIVPLSGNGLAVPAFSLNVNGGSVASATVVSGQPASYGLTLTPLNGFSGEVVLSCAPITPGQYASCSLLPSKLTLNGSAATSTATINTVTSVASASNHDPTMSSALAVCGLLPLGAVMLRRRRRGTLLMLLSLSALFVTGCGSGDRSTVNLADPNLRYTPPGTYQYQVTASSTSGAVLSQTVTLNLTVTVR